MVIKLAIPRAGKYKTATEAVNPGGPGPAGAKQDKRLYHPRQTHARPSSLQMLEEIYRACQGLQARRPLACRPGCSACCTDRLLVTTLEARYLARGLVEQGDEHLLRAAAEAPLGEGARPVCTFNQQAALCLQGREPPPEREPGPAAPCPLLNRQGHCRAYAHRPLACRTMGSLTTCSPGGQASQEALWLTLDTALFQLVEHLDQGGGFGPLPLALAAVGGPGRASHLLPCQPLPGLSAPPEHTAELRRFWSALLARPLAGRTLGQWLQA